MDSGVPKDCAIDPSRYLQHKTVKAGSGDKAQLPNTQRSNWEITKKTVPSKRTTEIPTKKVTRYT